MKNYVKNENGTVTITLSAEEFENKFCFCADCGKILFINDAVSIDGDYYCSDCTAVCAYCGCIIPAEESYHTRDSDCDYCNDCYLEHTYVCEDCGDRFRYGDSLTEANDLWYCERCIDNHRSIIEDYHTMKNYGDIQFFGDESRRDTPYMGFELEVDSKYRFDREETAEELKYRFPDFFAFENDGSLINGYEIISQPASLSYHMSKMPEYASAFQYLLENKVKSHDVGTCGLHIHIDRWFFGDKEDSSIAKLLYVFEKFRPELMKFSRRTEAQSSDWCRSYKQNYSGKAGWIKETVYNSKSYSSYQNRYYAVNLTNDNTIEIRLWRGTLNGQTFEATLKFTARLAELAKNTRAVDLARMTFEELLGSDEVILNYWNRIN